MKCYMNNFLSLAAQFQLYVLSYTVICNLVSFSPNIATWTQQLNPIWLYFGSVFCNYCQVKLPLRYHITHVVCFDIMLSCLCLYVNSVWHTWNMGSEKVCHVHGLLFLVMRAQYLYFFQHIGDPVSHDTEQFCVRTLFYVISLKK